MYLGFDFPLLFLSVILLVPTAPHRISRAFEDESPSDQNRNLLTIPFTSTVSTQSALFFQNEPEPLAPSVVDDLTTLASSIYIICVIVLIFVFLAWITHYNAPCSSMLTSVLSTITGLPEPIIRSVALCGACCVWCESTWMFRRIHQFNVWISQKVNRFFSKTCKLTFDTICPCCRPPDTPTNRSIIGSLPASIIAIIGLSDSPEPLSPAKTTVTTAEPMPLDSTHINIDFNTPKRTRSPNIDRSPTTRRGTGRKRGRTPRKRMQPKQRSALGEQPQTGSEINEEDDYDDDVDELDENTEMY